MLPVLANAPGWDAAGVALGATELEAPPADVADVADVADGAGALHPLAARRNAAAVSPAAKPRVIPGDSITSPFYA
jgi:hypothetical protein